MRLLIQVCHQASVSVESEIVSSIERGELVLVGFKTDDDERIVDRMVVKLLKLRIFPDIEGKTNLSLEQFGGNILAVSQFTLYGSLKEGNRPGYNDSMRAREAERLFAYFQQKLSDLWPSARYGVFKADMDVSLINMGPTTYLLDSEELFNE